KHKGENPAPLPPRSDLPEGLEEIVMRALAKEPEQRFEDASALLNGLSVILGKEAYKRERDERKKQELEIRRKFDAEIEMLKGTIEDQKRIKEKAVDELKKAESSRESIEKERGALRALLEVEKGRLKNVEEEKQIAESEAKKLRSEIESPQSKPASKGPSDPWIAALTLFALIFGAVGGGLAVYDSNRARDNASEATEQGSQVTPTQTSSSSNAKVIQPQPTKEPTFT